MNDEERDAYQRELRELRRLLDRLTIQNLPKPSKELQADIERRQKQR